MVKAPKQKCPQCGKKYARLQAHIDMGHNGKKIGQKASPAAAKTNEYNKSGLGGEIGRLEKMFVTQPEKATALFNDYIKGKPNLTGARYEMRTLKGQVIGKIIDTGKVL